MGSQVWEDHHVLPELQENLEELFPGLTIEEALQHQESLYQSLKISCVNQTLQTARSSDNEPSSSHGHSWGESSFSESCDHDLALDEAVARSLQELDSEDEVDHVAILESHRSNSRDTEHAAAGTSISETFQDPVDPDRMTYEELQSLGDAIGSENQGLSKREMSILPCYTYRTGFFSKKIDIGDCVICCTAYRNRDSVTTLPCAHQYHKDCIEPWLVKKRICPLCKKEVKLH
ncbi:hypothetical protein SOVF_083360 [Spinacia oleracea]|uniref:E3 ubiquitin ligase BIG BROTHER-like n=1 Tax=Spinacia oleracea TaxID=3562 RepID=A0A9R0I480_SPIOL|nr:E3 ubiquitin-protein ligase BIG BROTHER-like [Spinacia oleracea]XP_021842335.1 E3 ubiquitin-protein ligase BIG BROTHER-like [Spinacia oleracea]XP_021842338.1 E3 ubiquitin-protein ligase BIG BROTHER-like [Spinacia oleracea]XP_021842339.1 E3 ubiquitin-protein ligase BIG BROTHER-like [Spinacia oleracea]KNA17098.1 hypothetical protein SOVF_083360 [Spinacia oleracea]